MFVTSRVCSNWAVRPRSAVTAVQLNLLGSHDTPRLRTTGSVFGLLAMALPDIRFITGYDTEEQSFAELGVMVHGVPHGVADRLSHNGFRVVGQAGRAREDGCTVEGRHCGARGWVEQLHLGQRAGDRLTDDGRDMHWLGEDQQGDRRLAGRLPPVVLGTPGLSLRVDVGFPTVSLPGVALFYQALQARADGRSRNDRRRP